MKKTKVAILGAGNLGTAMAMAITKSEHFEVVVTAKSSGSQSRLRALGLSVIDNNRTAVNESKIVILAVRPNQVDGLMQEVQSVFAGRHQILSVVSGVSLESLRQLAPPIVQRVFRAMPNTACSVGQSITMLAENDYEDSEIKSVLSNCGQVMYLPETLFNQATVLAGSGIAIALTFIRALMRSGIQAGFHDHQAQKIAALVAKGAAEIIAVTQNHPEIEIDKVTTPGGCTIAALAAMEKAGFTSALLSGIEVSIGKAQELY